MRGDISVCRSQLFCELAKEGNLNESMVRLLLEYGADANAANHE
jgi:hypothetical protein